jgi:hypothetical protein
MDAIDPKVFAAISAITVGIVGALKRGFPVWVKGKEAFLSIIFPLLFVIVAKVSGQFAETPWADAMIWAGAAGPAAGLIHDKVVNPVLKAEKK